VLEKGDMFCEVPERPTESIPYRREPQNSSEIGGVFYRELLAAKIKCTPFVISPPLITVDSAPRGSGDCSSEERQGRIVLATPTNDVVAPDMENHQWMESGSILSLYH